jgi:hypothetical protein
VSTPVLSPAEREAMETARKNREAGSQGAGAFTTRDESEIFKAGWLACREWAEERHRKEVGTIRREAKKYLADAARVGLAVEERERVLREALEWIGDAERAETMDPADWAIEAHDKARAALASPTPQETPQSHLRS